MRSSRSLFLLASVAFSAVNAATLYAASYSGDLKTYSFTQNGDSFELKETSSTPDCGPQSDWIQLDDENQMLFCLSESNFVTAFKNEAGKLTKIQRETTVPGAVSSIFFNKGPKRGLALASYGGSGVTTFSSPPGGQLALLEELTFTMESPGPMPDRQDAPHPHQAIVDPSGKFLLFPDLGADLVRVYSYDAESNKLKELEPLKATPGSGPRHAAFWTPKCARGKSDGSGTYMHLVSELVSTLTSYKVTYSPDMTSISFEEVSKTGVLGSEALPASAAAAEIQISPDNNFVTVTSRFDSLFTAPNPDPSNSTEIASDSFGVFKAAQDGRLTYVGKFAAGGVQPRHFDISPRGDFVVVGAQGSNIFRIYKRNVNTGEIGPEVAAMPLTAPVATIWSTTDI